MSIAAAAPLLAFIRKTETGFSDARAYQTMYGHKRIDPPLTELTIDQAIDAGPGWTARHKSSAAGAYQFMRDTLRSLKTSLNLSGTEKLTPDFQDRLGYALLKRRGFEKFILGQLSVAQFGKNLAQEWASFPLLEDTQGAHRRAKRGQSFYVGDALNHALVKPEEVEALLGIILNTPAPKPFEPPARPIPVEPAYPPATDQPLISPIAVILSILSALVVIGGIYLVFVHRG